MSVSYLEKKYVKKNTLEIREYQVDLANQARNENCIVVLPTGLGKTAVALHLIAEFLEHKTGGILFLAPTRVLVNQHFDFLKNNLTIQDIAIITGEDPIKKRQKLWQNSVICATPEITKNDFDRQIVQTSQFSLVIFDEAHRTIGDYAYSRIAQDFASSDSRILGMTATLPSEKEKAKEIMKTLKITRIAQKSEDSPDVKPYTQQTNTEWIKVELPDEMKSIQTLLKLALDERYQSLAKNGLDLTNQKSLSGLLRARPFVLQKNRRCAKPLFTAIRITYALNILEAHGIFPFLKFCERTSKKKGIGVKELFEIDPNFTRAIHLAKSFQNKGIEHSKISKLIEILKTQNQKSIVFTSYRDSVELIHQKLTQNGITAGILIGKAGENGLKQKKQIEALQKFRDDQYQVLVATRVGEEGLDISEVNLVIFYDNVPSSIRYVQRRGRTGRKETGKLIVLIAKDTIDETYYWIGKRKMSAAKNMGEKMTQTLQNQVVKSKTQIDHYF